MGRPPIYLDLPVPQRAMGSMRATHRSKGLNLVLDIPSGASPPGLSLGRYENFSASRDSDKYKVIADGYLSAFSKKTQGEGKVVSL